MKAILIDDEPNATDMLSWQLEKYCPEMTVAAVCNDSRKAVALIREKKPDMIFLDIEMPFMNGFDILNECAPLTFDVVFVTAYDKFALKAFQFAAVDYLLKPVEKKMLLDAVARVKNHQLPIQTEQLELMKNMLQQKTKVSERIAISTNEGLRFISVSTIIRCETDGKYTMVYLTNGQKECLTRSLKDVEEMLEGHNFFRIHQSHLVNLNHIEKYIREDGGYIITTDKQHITVARARKDEFMNLWSRL